MQTQHIAASVCLRIALPDPKVDGGIENALVFSTIHPAFSVSFTEAGLPAAHVLPDQLQVLPEAGVRPVQVAEVVAWPQAVAATIGRTQPQHTAGNTAIRQGGGVGSI